MADEKQESSSKKGANLVLIIVAILLVVLLLIGGLVIFLLGSSNDTNVENPNNPTNTQEMTRQAPSPKERSNDFFNVGPMYPLDQFLVNLLSETGSRYLKIEINLELSSQALTPEIDQKKPLLRDILIRILTSKTYEDISTAKGKERLKDEMVMKLNEILRDGYIKNIFFTDFIVQ